MSTHETSCGSPSAVNAWPVGAVALEPEGVQPRGALPDGRFGPAESIGNVGQAAAAMLPVERRGQPHGRILRFRPPSRHCRKPPLVSAPNRSPA